MAESVDVGEVPVPAPDPVPVPVPVFVPVPGAAEGPGGFGPPGEAAVRDALSDWRQDAVLICLLPLLCWPAVIGALVTRPAPLRVVLLGLLSLPLLVGLRELYVVRRVRALLRAPGLRWAPYDARVLRARGLPPLLLLGAGEPWVLTLGLLGRRVLPTRTWARTDPGPPPAEPCVWLVGEPGPGAVVWAPRARELGRARTLRRRRR